MRPLTGDCPPAWSKRSPRRSQLGRSNDIFRPYLCQSTPPPQAIIADGLVIGRTIISHAIGASEAANTTETGRIAAGWGLRRGKVRRCSWPGRRRRAGGGVMATGNQVLPGAPVTGEHVAAGRPEAAEHATRLGHPLAAGQVGAGQTWPRTRHSWPGAGGRWLVWTARIALWAVVLLIGYRGVVAIVMGYPGLGGAAAPEPGPGNEVRGFPTALAQAYALEFGRVYLNFSPPAAAQRAHSLSTFLPPGTDPELGWNGAASRTLQSEQVARIDVVSSHRAVVTLLARVNGNLVELGVPIYASHRSLAVSGYPALLPAPGQVVPPAPDSVRQDRAAMRSLSRSLPGFFRS